MFKLNRRKKEQPKKSEKTTGLWFKRISKVFFCLVSFIFITFLASVLLLQTDTVQNKIKLFVEKAVAKNLHAELHLGRISGNLLFNIILEQVNLSDQKGPIFKAERIEVNYLIPMLLKKIVFIDDIRIKGLQASLIKGADGTWNITTLVPRDENSMPNDDTFRSFKFVLNRISVTDSRMALTQTGKRGSETRHIKDIRFVAGLKLQPELTAHIWNSQFTLDRPEIRLTDLNGRIAYDPEVNQCRLKQIRVKTEESELILNGTLAFHDQGPDMDVTATLKALSLTEVSRLASFDALDSAMVSGAIQARGTPNHLYHQLELNLDRMSLKTHGYINVTGTDGLGLDLSGTIRHLNPAALPFSRLPRLVGDINMDLTAEVSLPSSWDVAGLSAQVTTRINPSEFAGVDINQGGINAAWTEQQLFLNKLDLSTTVGSFALTGSAEPRNKTVRFRGEVIVPDLSKISSVVSQLMPRNPKNLDLKGSLTISGQLNGWTNRPAITATVNGSAIKFKQFSAKVLKLSTIWRGLPENFTSTALLNLQDFKVDDNLFPRFDIKANLTPAKTLMELKLEHKDGEKALLSGEIGRWSEPVKDITINTFEMASKNLPLINQMNNKGPIRMTISHDLLEIKSCTVLSQQAELSLKGFLTVDGKQSLKLSIKNLDLNRMSWLCKGGDRFGGQVSADLNISGTAEAPIIDANLSARNGSGYDFTFSKLDARIDYAQSKGRIKASLHREEKAILDLNGEAEFLLSLIPFNFKPLDGGLDATLETSDLKLSDLPIPEMLGLDFNGILDIHARATGNFTSPVLTGTLRLKDGFLSLMESGLTYENINAQIAFSSDKIIVELINIKGDEEGFLSCTGEVGLMGLKPSAFNLRLTGKNFYIPFKDAIYARVEPDLKLSGDLIAPRLTGDISITDSKINLDRLSDAGPAEIQVINKRQDENGEIYFPEQRNHRFDFVKPLTADVIINVPKNAWLKGQDVNTEMAGRVNLKKDPDKSFILMGSLRTIRGTYAFSNRQFKITQGKIDFIGLEKPNPNLDFQAVTRIDTVDIIINIGGTARQIELSLDSDPQMQQADIISYLVFGRPTSDLKDQQAFNAESAALSFTGQLAANELKNLLGDVFLLDTFSIDTGGDDISEGSVSLGKYITPDIFVTYRQGFNSEEPRQFEITYEMNRNFSLETQVGNEETSGVDLFWEYDF